LARAAHGSNGSIPEALKTVPVLLEPEADNEVHRTLSLVTKNMNNPLAPLETYAVVKRLEALGVSRQNIGTTLGLSRTYISNLGMLDNATDTVIELIRKGKATANLVIDMVRENKSAVAADELPTLIERAIVASAAKQEKEAARAAAAGKTISKKAKRKDTQQVIYTRETFKSLITVCQDLFAEMTPASEYKKWRGWIRNTLEGMNAPLAREDATEESDEE
jgi:ParB-like chromosome segregation protein Spo0J